MTALLKRGVLLLKVSPPVPARDRDLHEGQLLRVGGRQPARRLRRGRRIVRRLPPPATPASLGSDCELLQAVISYGGALDLAAILAPAICEPGKKPREMRLASPLILNHAKYRHYPQAAHPGFFGRHHLDGGVWAEVC